MIRHFIQDKKIKIINNSVIILWLKKYLKKFNKYYKMMNSKDLLDKNYRLYTYYYFMIIIS